MKKIKKTNFLFIFILVACLSAGLFFVLSQSERAMAGQTDTARAASSTLTIDANGGFYSGAKTIAHEVGVRYVLGAPTRPGFTFKGWALENGNGKISTLGKPSVKLVDGFFANSDNNVKVYNNLPNGTVSFEYLSSPRDLNFPHSTRVLEITTAGEASPDLGGFTTNLYSYANATFYTVIYAKIPVGYTIHAQANQHGGNTQDRWETDNQGTGKWKTYIYKWQCGDSGTFSTINFFNINGPAATASNPLKWQIAYVGTYDATGLNVTGPQTMASSTTFTYGSEDSKIVALWEAIEVNVNIDVDGGEYQGETSFVTNGGTLIGISTPEKEGYIFTGWTINGSGRMVEPQELTSGKTFNGTSDYVSLGRKYMYTDKFVFSAWAYMDDWNEMQTKNLRIISCAEGGGWNLQVGQGGCIDFIAYQTGVGYAETLSDTRWDSLSSGWHNFVGTFTGSEIVLYIDNNFIAKSSAFTNNSIYYCPTNSIIIGAEPGGGTSIDGLYFKGQIKNVMILNDVVYDVYNMTSQDQTQYFLTGNGDVSFTANWVETWASSDVVLEEIGSSYHVSTAEELGAIARMSLFEGQTFARKFIFLEDDIDLSGKLWLPISAFNTEFAGYFVGGGHTISGLSTYRYFEDSDTRFAAAGLIGRSNKGAEISNLRLTDVDIIGGSHVGGFVGHAFNTSISFCVLDSGFVDSRWEGGGIVGYSWDSYVAKCINRARIMAAYPGGIAGANYNQSEVQGSINFGILTSSSRAMCSIGGGIVGVNHNRISGCINYGRIMSSGDLGDIGGIAGWIQKDGEIMDCANYGIIDCDGNLRNAGAIVGKIVDGIELNLSYCSSISKIIAKNGVNNDYIFVGGTSKPSNSYANYASVGIDNGSGTTIIKQVSGLKNPRAFDSSFRCVEGINNNLPMQRYLFSVAQACPSQSNIYANYLSDFTVCEV